LPIGCQSMRPPTRKSSPWMSMGVRAVPSGLIVEIEQFS
jgi:hypothetical protein